MELRWRLTYSQQMIVTSVWLLVGLISCDARPGSRTPRWLQGEPEGISDEDIPNSLESNEAVLPPIKKTPAVQSTEPLDLIPKVDGLTFLNDQDGSPRVLRFYSARDPSPPPTGSMSIHSNDDGDSEGPELGPLVEGSGGGGGGVALASPERVSVQRIVAGVSFVGGLAVSLTVCLVCCRVRRGGRVARLFRRRVDDDVRVEGDDVTKPETATGDVKEAS